MAIFFSFSRINNKFAIVCTVGVRGILYTWILLWAEKSAGPQSGKIFRWIPKNAGDLKKHRIQDSEKPNHWSLPVPIAVAHLPNGL